MRRLYYPPTYVSSLYTHFSTYSELSNNQTVLLGSGKEYTLVAEISVVSLVPHVTYDGFLHPANKSNQKQKSN